MAQITGCPSFTSFQSAPCVTKKSHTAQLGFVSDESTESATARPQTKGDLSGNNLGLYDENHEMFMVGPHGLVENGWFDVRDRTVEVMRSTKEDSPPLSYSRIESKTVEDSILTSSSTRTAHLASIYASAEFNFSQFHSEYFARAHLQRPPEFSGETWRASGLWFLQHFSCTPEYRGEPTLRLLRTLSPRQLTGLAGLAELRGLASRTSAYFGRPCFEVEYVFLLQVGCCVGSLPLSLRHYQDAHECDDALTAESGRDGVDAEGPRAGNKTRAEF